MKRINRVMKQLKIITMLQKNVGTKRIGFRSLHQNG
jgi:hypothetical protein